MSTLLADGGFKDTAFSAQAVFRRVMDAFSRPGTIVSLDGFCAPPPRLGMATGAFLLALSDYDTPVWLEDPDLRASCAAWLGFQTGAPLAWGQDKSSSKSCVKLERTENVMPLAGIGQGCAEI